MRGYAGYIHRLGGPNRRVAEPRPETTLEDHILEENRGPLTILHARTGAAARALRRKASDARPWHRRRRYLVVPTEKVFDIRSELKRELV